MPDPLEPVSPGESVIPRLRADTVNAMLDAARDLRARKGGNLGGDVPYDPVWPQLTILIRNDSGAAVGQFGVLKITGVVASAGPVSHEFAFRDRPLFTGDTPGATTDAFAIAYEPIREDGVGRAVVVGVILADVEINDVAHGYATPKVGDTDKLTSAATGPARILWKETSGATRRCVVLLDATGSGSTFTAEEVDGSPSTTTKLKIPNSALTNNGDGTVTLNLAASGIPGLISAANQVMGDGNKTFRDAVIVNDDKGDYRSPDSAFRVVSADGLGNLSFRVSPKSDGTTKIVIGEDSVVSGTAGVLQGYCSAQFLGGLLEVTPDVAGANPSRFQWQWFDLGSLFGAALPMNWATDVSSGTVELYQVWDAANKRIVLVGDALSDLPKYSICSNSSIKDGQTTSVTLSQVSATSSGGYVTSITITDHTLTFTGGLLTAKT